MAQDDNKSFIQVLQELRTSRMASTRNASYNLKEDRLQNQLLSNLNKTMSAIQKTLTSTMNSNNRLSQNAIRVATDTNSSIKNLNRSITGMVSTLQKSISGLYKGAKGVAGVAYSTATSDTTITAIKRLMVLGIGGALGSMIWDEMGSGTKQKISSGFESLFEYITSKLQPMFEKTFESLGTYLATFAETAMEHFSDMKFDFSPIAYSISKTINKAFSSLFSMDNLKIVLTLGALIKTLPAIITAIRGGGAVAAAGAAGAGGVAAAASRIPGIGMIAVTSGIAGYETYDANSKSKVPFGEFSSIERNPELEKFNYVGNRVAGQDIVHDYTGTGEGMDISNGESLEAKTKTIMTQKLNFDKDEETKKGPGWDIVYKQLVEAKQKSKKKTGIVGHTENYVYFMNPEFGRPNQPEFVRYNKDEYNRAISGQMSGLQFGEMLMGNYEKVSDIASSLQYKPSSKNMSVTGNKNSNNASTISPEFLSKIKEVAARLNVDPQDLLAIMKHETAGSLSPSQKAAGSSGVGLIQFLDQTAKDLGTSTKDLSNMSQVEQMEYVEKYLAPKLAKLGDRKKTKGEVYRAITMPASLSDKSFNYTAGSSEYKKNSSWDMNKDGKIDADDIELFIAARTASDSGDPELALVVETAKADGTTLEQASHKLSMAGVSYTNTMSFAERLMKNLKKNKKQDNVQQSAGLVEQITDLFSMKTVSSGFEAIMKSFEHSGGNAEEIGANYIGKMKQQLELLGKSPVNHTTQDNRTININQAASESSGSGVPNITSVSGSSYNRQFEALAAVHMAARQ